MSGRPVLERLLVRPTATLREALAAIDANAKGIVVVTDVQHRLLGTVTDGDLRRAILAGVPLERSVQVVLERREGGGSSPSVTAPVGASVEELIQLMIQHTLRQIPVVDRDERVVDVAVLSDLVRDADLPLRALVMAGGYGTRLLPLTEEVPKPMVSMGGRPLLERIIGQLRDSGIHRVHVATHYKGELIERHFGDGKDFGVAITYVQEQEPLGTAGALGLLKQSEEPILVVNGDILTRVDFRAMLHFHRDHQADMTVGVRVNELRMPYGVVEMDGVAITGIAEKPAIRQFINAGLYLVQPSACHHVPADQRFDMTELISELIREGRRVTGFPVHEYWLDIGLPQDYVQAQAALERGETD